MVLDAFPPKSKSPDRFPTDATAVHIAHPLDRLGAVFVDLSLVLAPLFLFLVSPFRRLFMVALIVDNQEGLIKAILWMLFFGVLLLITYQSMGHYLYGKTIGKWVFGLKVQSIEGSERLTFLQSFLRSWIWVIEVILVAPWLSIFSHPRRRLLHDRLSDTIVLTVKTASSLPQPVERNFILWVQSAFWGAVAVVVVSTVTSIGTQMGISSVIKGGMAGLTSCLPDDLGGEVFSSQELDPEGDDQLDSWLDRLMALYSAGLIPKTCLGEEIEKSAGTIKNPPPLYYLAQSFVFEDQEQVSNEYLERVCTLAQDEACTMAKIVQAWSDKDKVAIRRHFASLANSKSVSAQVWRLKESMRIGDWSAARRSLDALKDTVELSSFHSVQTVKLNYLSKDQNEYQASLQAVSALLTGDIADDLNRWVCAQSLELGCDHRELGPCQDFRSKLPSEGGAQTAEVFTLAAKLSVCEDSQENVASMIALVDNKELQRLGRAIQHKSLNDISKAIGALEPLVDSENKSIRLAARSLWLNLGAPLSREILEAWSNEIGDLARDDEFRGMTLALFEHAFVNRQFIKAWGYGESIKEWIKRSKTKTIQLVVAGYNSGYRKEAFALMSTSDLLNEERAPAANGEAEVVLRVLRREFSKR